MIEKVDIEAIMNEVMNRNLLDTVLQESGTYNMNPEYVYTAQNVLISWGWIAAIGAIAALLAVILLEFVDRDKR